MSSFDPSNLKYAGTVNNSGNMTGTGPDAPTQTGGGSGGDLYGALINLGSTIYASETARNNSKRTIKANKALAEYGYSKDLEMWNLQNQYNNPSAQMARFADAGLNPNLIYGQGNSGNSATMPKYNAPTVSYDYMPPNIGGVLSGYQDFKMKQAQIDNVKAQTENTRNRTLTEAARSVLVGTQGAQAQQNLEFGEYVKPYQAAILGGQARSSEAKVQQEWSKVALMNQQQQLQILQKSYLENNIDLQGVQKERQQAQLIFDQQKAEWSKMGITSSDNVMLRIIVRMLNASGLSGF